MIPHCSRFAKKTIGVKVYLYPPPPQGKYIYIWYMKRTQFRSPLHQHSVKDIHQIKMILSVKEKSKTRSKCDVIWHPDFLSAVKKKLCGGCLWGFANKIQNRIAGRSPCKRTVDIAQLAKFASGSVRLKKKLSAF